MKLLKKEKENYYKIELNKIFTTDDAFNYSYLHK
jgi:hypothetical protein